jgi:hypothetical protein
VFPPNKGVEHEIHLQKDVPLPSIGMYRSSMIDNVDINKQV